MKRVAILAVVLVVCSCDHTKPFSVEDPGSVGPSSGAPPIQLTFSSGEDRQPSASSEAIVYSRLEPGRSDSDRCIAVLPAGGGTLLGAFCAGGAYADSMVDAWVEPAVSPDGRLAYVRDQGRPLGMGPSTRRVVVTPLENPDSILFDLAIPLELADGRRATAVQQVSWPAPGTLRFLVGEDVFVVNPPAQPDTGFNPYRVVDVAVPSGARREYAATEGTSFYANAPDGGIWYTRALELHHLPLGSDTTQLVGSFTGPVISMAAVGGQPAAVVLRTVLNPVGIVTLMWTEVERLDPVTGLPTGSQRTPGFAGRINGVPGTQRIVAEIIEGNQIDLWLLAIQ